MPRKTKSIYEEIAKFLASGPTREQLLNYHPSESTQRLAVRLLEKQNEGTISSAEKEQLEEFAQVERLFRLIKASLRVEKAPAV